MCVLNHAKRLALAVASVTITALSANAAPFFIAGPGALNVDTDPGTQVQLFSGLVGTINDLNVSVQIDGGHMEDFSIFLTSPLGTTVLLHSPAGNHLDPLFDVVFDDEAALPDSAIDAQAPSAIGTFQPVQSLSAFDGQQLFGLWTLTIEDTSIPDEGNELVSWSISGDANLGGAAAPEPGTLALLGLGALVGGLAVRRRLR